MELNNILLFAVASLSINLIPGPDVIYIVSNTMKGKMVGGLKAALGLGVGYFVHTLAAALGLSAIILSSSLVFSIIKWLGAIYLLYLGFSSLNAMWQGGSQLTEKTELKSEVNVFKQGIVVSVLNPKVALFFLSFLPQFLDTTASSVNMQLLILGLCFSGLATLCNIIYAVVGSWLLKSAKATRYSQIIEGISGVLLIGLAGKIALGKQ